MLTPENFADALSVMGFSAKGNLYTKEFPAFGAALKADVKAQKLFYPDEIKGRERNDYYDEAHKENLVVFECVNRLLEKGYRPEHIELEKEWHLGHDAKGGRADICVTDDKGKMLFIIECNTTIKEGMTAYKLNSAEFEVSIGNRVVSSEIEENGAYPVYSANVFEPFGRINKQNITDFSKPSILWGIDGDWMVNYIPENQPFYPTDHCGVLRVNTKEILPKYLALALRIEGEYEKFSRSNRASTQRIKNLTIQVPKKSVQQKIVDEIDAIDRKMREQEETVRKCDEDIKAKFVEMFGHNNYPTMRLQAVCEGEIIAGGDVPADNWSKNPTEEYTIPIFSNGTGTGALYGYTNISRINKDSLTIAARGTIGYCELRKAPFYPAIRLIVATPNTSIVNPQYLKEVLLNTTFASGEIGRAHV